MADLLLDMLNTNSININPIVTPTSIGDINKKFNFTINSDKIIVDDITSFDLEHYNIKFDFKCSLCDLELTKIDTYYLCDSCGNIREDLQDPVDHIKLMHQSQMNSHIRIVGPNAQLLQSNLYKSTISNYSTIQKITVEKILQKCRKKYLDKGLSSPIPINVCRKAVDLYNEVQQHCIKRSENKNVIIAACIYTAGNLLSFLPTNQEIADFMGLSTRGIAKGINFLIKLRSEGKLSFDINQNTLDSMILTLFEYLDIEDTEYIEPAIIEIVDTMKKNNIGCSLYIETKAKSVTYIVLIRNGTNIDINDYCERCKTRKNTVTNIVSLLDTYYDIFKPIYKKYNLYYKRKLKSSRPSK